MAVGEEVAVLSRRFKRLFYLRNSRFSLRSEKMLSGTNMRKPTSGSMPKLRQSPMARSLLFNVEPLESCLRRVFDPLSIPKSMLVKPDVRDISRPNLIRVRYDQSSEEIGLNGMNLHHFLDRHIQFLLAD